MSKILDGKKLRDQLVPQLIIKIPKTAYKPKLVIIQIGNIVAAGQPHLITSNYVSKNQIVVGVGIYLLKDKKETHE